MSSLLQLCIFNRYDNCRKRVWKCYQEPYRISFICDLNDNIAAPWPSASLVATIIATYAHWGFARVKVCGWGRAGVLWLYSIVIYIPLDILKFMICYSLNGKAW
ncbi:uncharacterized protein A4U43_C05F10420 [Asparagus officinalis]|uniref:Uncharacterized protein n=1 Tax=Asparagus officinalis TaxID=4686 RepID=A0A5P1EQP7_ASPOF|nr:uncharacterized protein A4U43_C05F10420 [Asparagus officinalis]